MTIEQLQALGITPLEILTLMLVAGLVAYIRREKADQEVLRSAWHAETRAEVALLNTRLERAEQRADSCETDRQMMKRDMDDLRRMVTSCHLAECPLRGR